MAAKKAEPLYHGADLPAALKRARAFDGYVILSKAPEGQEGAGYWSDAAGFTRNWELGIYAPGESTERALLAEAKRTRSPWALELERRKADAH